MKILEFRVEYTYLLVEDDKAELEDIKITHVATRELYLIKNDEGSINNINEIDLVPFLDS